MRKRSSLKSARNRGIYDRLWSRVPLTPPNWFSTWKVVSPVASRGTVIEIGSGARPRAPVRGTFFLDLSPNALKKLRDSGGICACADAQRLPFASLCADAVVAFDVVEHVRDDIAFFRELVRVLRPGGAFFFSVPLQPQLFDVFDRVAGHYRRYDAGVLQSLLDGWGFTVESWFSYGTRPKSVFVDRVGAWWLERYPAGCAWCRDILFRAFGRDLQRPLRPATGRLADAGPGVAGAAVMARFKGLKP